MIYTTEESISKKICLGQKNMNSIHTVIDTLRN